MTASHSPTAPSIGNPPLTQKRKIGIVVLLLCIVTGGTLARLHNLGFDPFWIDEFLTLETINGLGQVHKTLPRNEIIVDPPMLTSVASAQHWTQIWSMSDGDAHPPLFYFALRAWRDSFGDSETQLRSMSVVFSVVSILLVFVITHAQFGPTPALWAALLMAVASPQIRYAQEARGYAMAQTLLLLAAWGAIRLGATHRTFLWAAVLFFSTLAALMTNYLTAAPLVAVGVWTLLQRRARNRFWISGSLACAALTFVVLWGAMFIKQMHVKDSGAWMPPDAANHVALSFWRFLALPIQLLGRATTPSRIYAAGSVVVFLLPLLLCRRNPRLLLWCLWLACTIVPLTIVDLTSNNTFLSFIRYFLFASPAICILMAAMLAHQKGWMKHVLPACATLYAMLSVQQAYADRSAAWREIAATIHRQSRPGQVVIFASDSGGGWEDILYVGCAHQLKRFPGPVLLMTRPPHESLMKTLAEGDSVWLVLDGVGVSPATLLPEWNITFSRLMPGVGYLHRLDAPFDASRPIGPEKNQ